MDVYEYQLALFPKHINLDNPSRFVSEASEKLAAHDIRLDRQQVLPVQITGPMNNITSMLHIVAESTKSKFQLQVSTEKVVIILGRSNETTPVDYKKFRQIAKDILTIPFLEDVEYKRIGFIKTLLIDTENYAVFAKKLLDESWEENINTFGIRLGYRQPEQDTHINVNILMESIIKLGLGTKAFSVQFDVSTAEDEDDISSISPDSEVVIDKLADESRIEKYIQLLEEDHDKTDQQATKA